MTQTGGLALLFGWLIFAGLLIVLAAVVLRHNPDVMKEARRSITDEPHRSSKSGESDW